MTKATTHLLDVNGLIALLDESHIHHDVVTQWFETPALQWALCPFTESGLLRFMTRPKTGEMSMEAATAMIARLHEHPGFHYQPVTSDWLTLTAPFFKRLHGYKQITDAYLLGLAVHENLILVTCDTRILHLAGEHAPHVRVLENSKPQ